MKFPENNKILYSQDFSIFESVPSDVDFSVEPLGNDKVMLTAPNYGGKPYGNGRLYLSCGFAFSGLTKRAADKWRAALKKVSPKSKGSVKPARG